MFRFAKRGSGSMPTKVIGVRQVAHAGEDGREDGMDGWMGGTIGSLNCRREHERSLSHRTPVDIPWPVMTDPEPLGASSPAFQFLRSAELQLALAGMAGEFGPILGQPLREGLVLGFEHLRSKVTALRCLLSIRPPHLPSNEPPATKRDL
jgi:hypothetical protein